MMAWPSPSGRWAGAVTAILPDGPAPVHFRPPAVEATMEPATVSGDPPQLAGQRCDAILCQQFWHGGRLVDPAHVTFLCFEGRWHRLYFDGGVVYWRTAEGEPEPFEAPELDSAYPVTDVAQEKNLRGVRLVAYRTEPLASGVQITFAFEGGSRLAFRDDGDTTTCIDG
jgi:hypothetical protein